MNINKTRREFIKTTSAALACASLSCDCKIGWAKSTGTGSGASALPQRILGRTKLPVSVLGFGVGPMIDAAVYRRAFDLGITPMKPLAGRFYKETSDDSGPLLRWLAADPRVHTIPVGMKTMAHVEQNVNALRTTLSDPDRGNYSANLVGAWGEGDSDTVFETGIVGD